MAGQQVDALMQGERNITVLAFRNPSAHLALYHRCKSPSVLEEDGLLTLRAAEGNRKNKKIHLTEKGEKLVEQIVDPLMDAEVRATESLGEQEMEKFLQIMKRQTELFREEIANFTSPHCDKVAQK